MAPPGVPTDFPRPRHVAENLGALDGADLSTTELQLLSALATLAEPLPPGDGFVTRRQSVGM